MIVNHNSNVINTIDSSEGDENKIEDLHLDIDSGSQIFLPRSLENSKSDGEILSPSPKYKNMGPAGVPVNQDRN